MTRKTCLLPLMICCAATPSLAADFVTSTPEMTWSGIYLGVNGGIASGTDREQYRDPALPLITIDWSAGGGFAGGQVGYNWQFSPSWIVGVEADYQAAAISSGTRIPGRGKATRDVTSFGTVRGRVGYALGDTLLYGTGGYAWGRGKATNSSLGIEETVGYSGWAAGAGIEQRFAPGWSAKVEYLRVDLGREPRNYLDIFGLTDVTLAHRFDSIRAGLNYRFGDNGPAAAPSTEASDWSGFYAGVNGGYSAGDFTTTQLIPFNPGFVEVQPGGGRLIGAQIGYNWQISPAWVAGVEVDYQASSLKGGFENVDTAGEKSEEVLNFGTLRGRLGYVLDSNLIYATGGLAWGKNKLTANNTFLPIVTASHTGWTAGLGVEHQFTPNWSGKVEYLYTDLGTKHYAVNVDGINMKSTFQMLRAGVNYRFGGF